MIDGAIADLVPLVGVRDACAATGRPQANHYRWQPSESRAGTAATGA
jgi:hypothetical protein